MFHGKVIFFKFKNKMELKYITPKIRIEENTVDLMCFFLEKVLASSSDLPSGRLPKYIRKSITLFSCWVLQLSHDLGKLSTLLRI